MGEHRVAVVGAGRIGRLHAGNLAALDRLSIVAVADPDRDAVEDLATSLGCDAHSDWQELLGRTDVDALVLCSPSPLHPEQICRAAEAGKHVFCEKPIGADLERADEALDAAASAGIVLQVGYNRRFDRSVAELRAAVAAGRVGDVVLVRITARDPEPPTRSYLLHTPGLFVDSTSHDLDLVRFLTGGEIVEVSARAASLVSEDARELGQPDTAVTTVALDNGALGVIDNCWSCAYGYDQRFEVHGTRGMAQVRNHGQDTVASADGRGLHTSPAPHFFVERYAATFVAELRSFADALDGGTTPVTGRDGRQALAASLAAQRSAAEGRVVAVAA